MSVSQDTTAPAAEQGCGDKRRLVKTKTPGVFKRIDGNGRTIGYACVLSQRHEAGKAPRPQLRGGEAVEARDRDRP